MNNRKANQQRFFALFIAAALLITGGIFTTTGAFRAKDIEDAAGEGDVIESEVAEDFTDVTETEAENEEPDLAALPEAKEGEEEITTEEEATLLEEELLIEEEIQTVQAGALGMEKLTVALRPDGDTYNGSGNPTQSDGIPFYNGTHYMHPMKSKTVDFDLYFNHKDYPIKGEDADDKIRNELLKDDTLINEIDSWLENQGTIKFKLNGQYVNEKYNSKDYYILFTNFDFNGTDGYHLDGVIRLRTAKILVYDSNGGNGKIDNDTRKAINNGAVTFNIVSPESAITRKDYTFKEWNTKADGSGITYVPGSTLTTSDTVTTIYAIWEPDVVEPVEYTKRLFYDANGGEGTMTHDSSTTSEIDGEVTFPVKESAFVREGYNFLGWSTDKDTVTPSVFSTDDFKTTAETTILYAIWEEIIEEPKEADSFNLTVNYYYYDENGNPQRLLDANDEEYVDRGTIHTLGLITNVTTQGRYTGELMDKYFSHYADIDTFPEDAAGIMTPQISEKYKFDKIDVSRSGKESSEKDVIILREGDISGNRILLACIWMEEDIDSDVVVDVYYNYVAENTTPMDNPDTPVPTTPDTPTPTTPNNPVVPVIPGPTVILPVPGGITPVTPTPVQAVGIANDAEGNLGLVPVEDLQTALANLDLEHVCNILYFLILFSTSVAAYIYFRSTKKHQARIYELRSELGEDDPYRKIKEEDE